MRHTVACSKCRHSTSILTCQIWDDLQLHQINVHRFSRDEDDDESVTADQVACMLTL